MMTRELTSVCNHMISVQNFFFLRIIQTPIRDKQQPSTTIRTLPSEERMNRACKKKREHESGG
jgi:hypothetical protein